MIHLRFQVPHSTHDLFLQGSSRPKMTRGEKRYQTKQFAQPVLANQTNVYEETDVILWKDDASPGVEPARCEWLVEEQRRDLLQAKFTEVMCDSPGTARDVNTGSACPLRWPAYRSSHSASWEEHLQHNRQVLKRLLDASLTYRFGIWGAVCVKIQLGIDHKKSIEIY